MASNDDNSAARPAQRPEMDALHAGRIQDSTPDACGVCPGLVRCLLVAFACAAASCASKGPPPLPTGLRAQTSAGESAITITAKLRDLRPALVRAISKDGLAILHETGGESEGRLNFELVGIKDESGLFAAAFAPTGGTLQERRQPTPLRLTARLTPFGDPPRERALLDAVAQQLLELAKQE